MERAAAYLAWPGVLFFSFAVKAPQVAGVKASAGDDDPDDLTETFWSGLHGLLTLMRSGRLRRESHHRRLALLISHFAPPA